MTRPSQDWAAVESTNIVGKERKLVVTGEVETHRSNERVTLTCAKPQGINPAILILDCAVASEGVGNEVMGSTQAVGLLSAE